MKWYVLKVGSVFVLLAIILDVLDVRLGGFHHLPIARPVIYFWVAVLAFTAAFDFVVQHRHLDTISSFSPLLDAGEKPEIAQGWNGTTLVTSIAGQYRGRLMSAKMRGSYGQRNPLISVTITLACEWPWAFSVQRRTIGARIMEAFGEVRLGEPELDEELAISGDDSSALRLWLSRPETRQLVRQLTVEHHAPLATVAGQSTSVTSLQSSYSPYHWYYRPHFPAVLEILYALAASLDGKAASVAR